MFGNTEQVGRAVADGLGDGGVDAAVVDVATAPVDLFAQLDLLVLGAPTHAFSLSRPGTRADAVRQGAAPERAARGMREWLSAVLPRRGLTVLGRPQAFLVADVTGPLVDGELARATAWGSDLASRISARAPTR